MSDFNVQNPGGDTTRIPAVDAADSTVARRRRSERHGRENTPAEENVSLDAPRPVVPYEAPTSADSRPDSAASKGSAEGIRFAESSERNASFGGETEGYPQSVRLAPAGRQMEETPASVAAKAAFADGRTTPRPKALDRASAQGAASSQRSPGSGSELRHPVNDTGYVRQPPLGRAYDAQNRPINPRGSSNSTGSGARDSHSSKNRGSESSKASTSKPLGKGWILILLVLVILALLVLGLLLVPDDLQNPVGDFKRMVTGAFGFTEQSTAADPTATPAPEITNPVLSMDVTMDGKYVPAVATLHLVTDSGVSSVQLFNAEGQQLECAVSQEKMENGTLEWDVQVVFDKPYWGTIRAQVLTENGWQDAGDATQISVIEETVLETSTEAPAMQVINDIKDFSASPSQGKAPVNIAFSMTTSLSITDVRLTDDSGNPLEAEASVLVDNASTRIWALNYSFDRPYDGAIRAQAKVNGAWVDSNKLVSLSIQGPTVTAAPVTSETDEAETIETVESDEAVTVPEADAEKPAEPTETAVPIPTIDLPAPQEEVLTAAPILMDPEDAAAMEEWEDVDWGDEVEDGGDEADRLDEHADDVPDETISREMPADAEDAPEQPDAAPTQIPLVNNALPVLFEGEESATPAWEPEVTPAPEADEGEVVEAVPERVKLTASADASADPAIIKNAVIYSGTKKTDTYERPKDDLINMPDADSYCIKPYGVMTFRGSSFRQNAVEGTVASPGEMEVLWSVDADSVKSSGKTVFYGVGWTGQPLIIKWSIEVREMSNIYDEKKSTKALREVIVAGEDGRIYFLDLQTGEKTRATMNLGYPMRGTPSVHTLGFPVLSVGQYARKMAGKTYDIGMRVFNLLNGKQLFMIDGLDGKLNRPYYDVGSFETSSLYDYNSDTMITIGTNGMLYTTKLKAVIDRTAGTISVNPAHVSLKSKATTKKTDKTAAVESSMAAYQQYVFYADMGGVLRCVDTDTMTTVWAVNTGDAVEASVALDLVDEGKKLWLYTANTLQNRKSGDCVIRRYNAMTGALDWEYKVPVKKNTKSGITAGAKASPVIGRNGLDDYVYFTVSLATQIDGSAADGVIICLNKETGERVWQRPLSSYSYSSPVAVYSDEGKGWIIQAASDGTIELMNGLTGEPIAQLKLDGTINASPAVYKNIMVIATQGKGKSKIYGIRLK